MEFGRENPHRLIPPIPTMSEFEKKTLCYAFLWSWFLVSFPLPFQIFFEINRGFHLLVMMAGLLACFVLNSVFGLWGVFWNGGPYYRENNLTEREKFLTYKATSRTLVVFVIIFLIVFFPAVTYHGITNKKWTVEFIDIGAILFTTAVVFGVVKSFVLLAFLRKERRRNSQT